MFVKGVVMKNGVKLHDWQNKNKEEPTVPPITCHICKKTVVGAYGWTDLEPVVGSCSAKCESEMAKLREVRYANKGCIGHDGANQNG